MAGAWLHLLWSRYASICGLQGLRPDHKDAGQGTSGAGGLMIVCPLPLDGFDELNAFFLFPLHGGASLSPFPVLVLV